MTRTSLALVVLLVGGAVTACGERGSSGAPADASVTAFCGVHRGDSVSFLTYREDPTALEEAMRDWGDELAAVGTPEDIPDDARQGFELVVERMRGDVDGGADAAGSEAERAYLAYVEETCGTVEDLGLPQVPALPIG